MNFIRLVISPIWKALVLSGTVALTTIGLAIGLRAHTNLQNRVIPTPTPTIVASPSATMTPTTYIPVGPPLIDCVGPDGKHLHITQKACDNFNNAWKPTATPVPQQSSSSSNSSNNSGSNNSNSGWCNGIHVEGAICAPNTSATITTQPVTWTFP